MLIQADPDPQPCARAHTMMITFSFLLFCHIIIIYCCLFFIQKQFFLICNPIKAWNVGTSTTTDNLNFRMTNAAYNGAQTAGTIWTVNAVGFTVSYVGTNVPIITAVLFNGVNICSSSGSKLRLAYACYKLKVFIYSS